MSVIQMPAIQIPCVDKIFSTILTLEELTGEDIIRQSKHHINEQTFEQLSQKKVIIWEFYKKLVHLGTASYKFQHYGRNI